MRAVVQRVRRASVRVGEETIGDIGTGLVALVGVTSTDSPAEARRLASKLWGLRVFGDLTGAMNLSLDEVGGAVLVVSQFTLYGDTTRGRRPSWAAAAPADQARPLVEAVVDALAELGASVVTGVFGARMHVELENEGPVTLLLEV